jgi:hypothetical protein
MALKLPQERQIIRAGLLALPLAWITGCASDSATVQTSNTTGNDSYFGYTHQSGDMQSLRQYAADSWRAHPVKESPTPLAREHSSTGTTPPTGSY